MPEELDTIRADEVKLEKIDWLWPGRFALGKLGLLGGNPERGKGLIVADIFSRLTRGAHGRVMKARRKSAIACCYNRGRYWRHHRATPGGSRRRSLPHPPPEHGQEDRRIGKRASRHQHDLPMLEKVLEDLADPLLLASIR